jgi:hypothetical protein
VLENIYLVCEGSITSAVALVGIAGTGTFWLVIIIIMDSRLSLHAYEMYDLKRANSFILLLLSVDQQEMSLKVLLKVSCINSTVHYIYLNASETHLPKVNVFI